MIKSRNTQFTHCLTYQEAKCKRKKLKIFNITRASSDATSQKVIFLTSREAHVKRIIMFTILTDNIFKLWGLSLAKSALYLSDGTTASIASP